MTSRPKPRRRKKSLHEKDPRPQLPKKYLRRGDRGPDVANLKKLIRGSGLLVAESDLFDLGTEAAIMEIQALSGIDVDGIYGPQTRYVFSANKFFNEDINPIGWVAFNTPYYSQRDNMNVPGGTCNVTSLAMVLGHWGFHADNPNQQLEDQLFEMLQTKSAQKYFKENFPGLYRHYKPRNSHGMMTWLAKQFRLQAEFKTNVTWKQMESFGSNYGPMIISGSFTGSGHIVTLCGMTSVAKHLIVHDPYGDWRTGYQSHEGAFRIYPRDKMRDVLKGDSRDQKWCHLIRPRSTLRPGGIA